MRVSVIVIVVVVIFRRTRLRGEETRSVVSLHAGFKDDRSGIDFTQIGDEFIRIIHDSESHRYLGRKLNLHAKSQIAMEFSNRKQQIWFAVQ